MKNCNPIVFLFLISFNFSGSVFATGLDSVSIKLARCEFIYAYTGQYFMINNNIGAALNTLRRSALVTTANMMRSAIDGKIPYEIVNKWKKLRAPIKDQLDNHVLDPLEEATKCDASVLKIAAEVRDARKILWGKSFDQLHDLLFIKLKTSVGL